MGEWFHQSTAHLRVPVDLGDAIRAYDLQPQNVSSCQTLCATMLEAAGASTETAMKLAHTWARQADFLLDGEPVRADIVIGNPPYIRIEDLPGDVSAAYRRAWPTMMGRADIYVGFFERSLGMLKPEGRIGFIESSSSRTPIVSAGFGNHWRNAMMYP